MARILLVDDEKMAQTVYGEYLAQAGHEVATAGTVEEAKTALSEGQFDAVVTDLMGVQEPEGLIGIHTNMPKVIPPAVEQAIIAGNPLPSFCRSCRGYNS